MDEDSLVENNGVRFVEWAHGFGVRDAQEALVQLTLKFLYQGSARV